MFVIPASLVVLPKICVANPIAVTGVLFERRSEIRRLDRGTFSLCTSLQWIHIAASVEFIASNCFTKSADWSSPLKRATVEEGSRLREIERGAFKCCFGVTGITIPASVEKMNGGLPPRVRRVVVAVRNPHFVRIDDFLMTADHRCVLRYFGRDSKVRISPEIETIEESCLARHKSLGSVVFSPDTRLSSIAAEAFESCGRLGAITIPSTVRFLGGNCFRFCRGLKMVSFLPDSQLNCLSEGTFLLCSSLSSITIPSRIKTIGARCFQRCRDLVDLRFPVDAELVRIEEMAFSDCRSLRSFFVPSSVEFVGDRCFENCTALDAVKFGSAPHLRELLDLELQMPGCLEIPDCVEILRLRDVKTSSARARSRLPWVRMLTFGCESRLSEFRVQSKHSIWRRVFVKVSSPSLKAFRNRFEFEPDH
jgi:hypothetical protein